jgi:histidine triad (HIT) family protein
MTSDPECIFCKIVAHQIPASLVYEDERMIGFRDLNPQAPVHVLLIPREHIANTETLRPEHDAVVGGLMRGARDVARDLGLSERGYRVVVNTGRDANNTVDHLHVHLLGGRAMSWPPG